MEYIVIYYNFASVKLIKNNQSTKGMEIKTLRTATLEDALAEMKVGETAYAPEGYTPKTVMVKCNLLKEKGYLFTTSRRAGAQTVTRLQ